MSTFLVTLIFLLANGAPAKQAIVTCEGLLVFVVGQDTDVETGEGWPIVLDSRGAAIVSMEKPTTITCRAFTDEQSWYGPIHLEKHGQVERIYLAKDS